MAFSDRQQDFGVVRATFSGRANDLQGRMLLGYQLTNDTTCCEKAERHTRVACKPRAAALRIYFNAMQLA
jgi:hypothetical protein